MRLASIDVGSNTIRLLTGDVKDGKVKPLMYKREITRLASGIKLTGRLSETAMEGTLRALRDYAEAIRGEGAVRARAVGTSALREAENSAEFVSLVKRETGLYVETISGEEESGLTARGVMSSLSAAPECLIFDMGGGSTEVVLVRGGEIIKKRTFPTGVVGLLEGHMRTDPPSVDDIRSLEEEAEHAAGAIKERFGRSIRNGFVLIGTAGTATTLASLDLGLAKYDRGKVHMHKITLERLQGLSRKLASMTLRERAGLDGLEPERADLIIPGITFTIKLMEALGFYVLTVSDSGLLEGILIELSREAVK